MPAMDAALLIHGPNPHDGLPRRIQLADNLRHRDAFTKLTQDFLPVNL
jgi:hypothetical protein